MSGLLQLLLFRAAPEPKGQIRELEPMVLVEYMHVTEGWPGTGELAHWLSYKAGKTGGRTNVKGKKKEKMYLSVNSLKI